MMLDKDATTETTPDKPAKRRAGRPAKAILAAEPITRAALGLIQSGGYKGLTMAALAQQLDVAPSALYNHVRSKQDVLALVQDHLMSFVDVGAFASRPWHEAVRAWARSYRDVFAQHTPLIPIIAVQPIADSPQTLRIYEAVAQGFRRAGWPEAEIVDAIVALESFIYGSALDVNAPENIFAGGNCDQHATGFSSAVKARETLYGRYSAERAFELGLESMIHGMRTRHPLS